MLPPAPADSFTVAVLPDTQQYVKDAAQALHAMTGWVAAHRDDQRIVFCSHVGDVVRHYDRPEEWAVAHAAMARLDGVVPYGISVGNNDMDEESGRADLFCGTFPVHRYAGRPWYGGAIRDNADSWQTFESGGLRFLVLHLECNAPDDVLAWADEVLERNADRHAIVTAHMFLGPLDEPVDKRDYFTAPRGVACWSKCHGGRGNAPRQIWDKCLSRHPNLFLILCGDQSRVQAMRLCLAGRQGNPVQVCLCDYYGAPEGWIRLHRFLPARHEMQVTTYGAVSGTICDGTPLVPDRGQHQFRLAVPWHHRGDGGSGAPPPA
jgi:hypothetical protein